MKERYEGHLKRRLYKYLGMRGFLKVQCLHLDGMYAYGHLDVFGDELHMRAGLVSSQSVGSCDVVDHWGSQEDESTAIEI